MISRCPNGRNKPPSSGNTQLKIEKPSRRPGATASYSFAPGRQPIQHMEGQTVSHVWYRQLGPLQTRATLITIDTTGRTSAELGDTLCARGDFAGAAQAYDYAAHAAHRISAETRAYAKDNPVWQATVDEYVTQWHLVEAGYRVRALQASLDAGRAADAAAQAVVA